jgi:transcriptional repressor NrdR
MRCPYCGNPRTKVIDSRGVDEGAAIRRRRRCESCGQRFTTFERREKVQVTIIKRDGRAVPYDRMKIASGMFKACNKLDVPAEVIEKALDEIEEAIMRRGEKELPVSVVGELVMDKLRQIDEVAYVRFASVYKRFGNVSEFGKELDVLKPDEEDASGPGSGPGDGLAGKGSPGAPG